MNFRPKHQSLRKVPEITALFWAVKLLSTAMGESTADYFVFRINPYVAVIISAICLVIALIAQFWVHKYIAWVYWLTVVMVAVSGTMAADVLHIQFGIPYLVSSLLFAMVLAVIFIAWHTSEKTLSIHTINSSQRETFYWLAVMATFALGTAAGDMAAITLGLGYFSSGLLFLLLIAMPTLGRWAFGMNEISAFWWAYILTRPLGASFADWLGKPTAAGGLGFGDEHVSLALSAFIIAAVAYMTFSRREARKEESPYSSRLGGTGIE